MSGFSVKRVNVVDAFASLWAFIFAFFPFYRIEPMEVLIQQAGKQAESYALTKNLVSYNFFGVLCLMLSIVAFGLYIWNSSQLVRAAAIIVSVVDFISLMLALIVGNSNIKDIKSIITYGLNNISLIQYEPIIINTIISSSTNPYATDVFTNILVFIPEPLY